MGGWREGGRGRWKGAIMSAILTRCVKSAEGIVGAESTILSSCEECFLRLI